MKRVKRYIFELPDREDFVDEIYEDPRGEWVRHDDYLALYADKEHMESVLEEENAALAADRDKWKSWADAENKDRKRDHADACDYIQMIVKEKNALAAENERLQGNLAGRDAMIMGRDSIIKCREDEIERLRKAGDAMAKHYFDLYWIMNAESTSRHEPASITDWEAAKEGSDAK